MRWQRMLWWTTAVIFFAMLVAMLQGLQFSIGSLVVLRFLLLAVLAIVPAILFALWEGWRHS